jgi:hypothetical protein
MVDSFGGGIGKSAGQKAIVREVALLVQDHEAPADIELLDTTQQVCCRSSSLAGWIIDRLANWWASSLTGSATAVTAYPRGLCV